MFNYFNLLPFRFIPLVYSSIFSTLGANCNTTNVRIPLILSLLLIGIVGCKNNDPTTNTLLKAEVVNGSKLGETDFEDLNGNPVALSDFKGKRVVLNYWATWCRPCIAEMPSILRAQDILEKEGYVFLLASDQAIETIKEFKQKKEFDFTYLKFNGSLAEQQINALPASFIYNSKGALQFKVMGAKEWDSPESLEELKDVP